MDGRQETWKRFIDRLPTDGSLSRVILESWRRTQAAEDTPEAGGLPLRSVGPDDLQRRLEVNKDLMAVAIPHLGWIATATAQVPHVVFLTDRDGIVLFSTANQPDRTALFGLMPGYDWSEEAMGTNGAGTALRANRPVVVVGPEHISGPLDDCTCTGAPVHGHDGTLVGAIAINTGVEDGSPERLVLTAHTAHVIEQELAYRLEIRRLEVEALGTPDVEATHEQERRLREQLEVEKGRLEEVRREADQRVLSILENMTDAFFALDRQCRFTFLNRRAEQVLRRSRSQLLGKNIWDEFPHAVGTTFYHKYHEALEAKGPVDFEEYYPLLNLWLEVHTYPTPEGFGVYFREITERKTKEAEVVRLNKDLERRVTEFQALLDVIPTGIAIAHDTASQRITVNPALGKMLRIPPGANASKTAPADERPTFRVYRDGREIGGEELPMQVAAREGVPVHDARVEVVHEDGERLHLLGSAMPLKDEQGKVRGAVGSFLDDTARQRLDAELHRRVEELAARDKRNTEFLATLAHELRNSLAPIRNALHILRQSGVDQDAARTMRAMMERQVECLARLVDDLLNVSRISRGKVELHKKVVELGSVVNSAVEGVGPLIEERHHELTVSLPPETVRLEADPIRLEQVLTNLLHNAARYTEPGGRIWLEAKQEDREVVLRVHDNGIGIAPEMLPRIFDLFVQAEPWSQQGTGGLGIGLTLVRSLVELHGGTVQARSGGRGKGSEFIVRLPAYTGQPLPVVSTDLPPGEQISKVKRRILVADDNPDIAQSLAMMLEMAGHEVQVACDGLAALEVAHRFGPEVVFLDLGMPKMDGYETARRMRREPGLRGVMLVAVTGWDQEEHRRRTLEAGFDHHLVKPVEPAALEKLLADVRSPGV